MNQQEKREYLIKKLAEGIPWYQNAAMPEEEGAQKRLLRSLMNVRPPVPASQEFLKIQDEYLSEENRRKGIVNPASFLPAGGNGRIFLWQGDITRLEADAIVNAANSALLGCFQPCHSCIDNVIHSWSGIQLRLACHELMQAQGHEEPVGTAKITSAFNLPSRFVLHTVGPAITGALKEEDCQALAGCYQSCLELAVQNGVRSIAFCCISTGVFCFPREKAAEIAVNTVRKFLEQDKTIRQVIFDVYEDRDLELYRRLLE